MVAVSAPLVSVIMIFLDEVDFIEEAIASVQAQSMTDWELLLVDDGSGDGSSEIARRHAGRDPARIRYLTHPGGMTRGTGPSRQLGLLAARGRHVAFLDADDVYLPRRLAAHVEVLERMSDVDVVQSYHVNWHSWRPVGDRPEDDYLQGAAMPGESVFFPPAALINSLANVDAAVGMDTITIRREAALRHGGFEVQFTSIFEDQAFLTKLYLQHTVYLLPACLARYRMHPRSTVESAFASAHEEDGEFQRATRALADWQLGYVGAQSAVDRTVHELVQGRARAARARGLRWQGVRHYTTGMLRRLLWRLLPDSAYAAVRSRRRVRMQRRLMADYLAICDAQAAAEAATLRGLH
jgi:glycosyltransferase involved in cell wall biosynthesis